MRPRTTWIQGLVFVVAASFASETATGQTPGSAQDPVEPQPIDCSTLLGVPQHTTRDVCTTSEPRVPREFLAQLFAPAMLFAPAEEEWPTNLPCDMPTRGQVVYWNLRQVRPLGNMEDSVVAALEAGLVPLDLLERLTVHYAFYYARDYGLGGHVNDLEGFEVTIRPVATPAGLTLRLERLTGLAHGKTTYYNIAQPGPASSISLPLKMFVEQGKHASSPDVNGDGLLTPGIDITERLADAWGIRDHLAEDALIQPRWAGYMALPRATESASVASAWTAARHKTAYLLRDAEETDEISPLVHCRGVTRDEAGQTSWVERLAGVDEEGLLRRYEDPTPDSERGDSYYRFASAFRWRLLSPMSGDGRLSLPLPARLVLIPVATLGIPVMSRIYGAEAAGIGVRYDGRVMLRMHQAFWVDVAWLYTSVRVGGEPGGATFGGALLGFAPSVTRWADWFVATGFEVTPEDDPIGDRADFQSVAEAGLRIRTPCVLATFCQANFGVSWIGLPEPHKTRLFVELAWGDI